MAIKHWGVACDGRDDERMLRHERHLYGQRLSATPDLANQRKQAVLFQPFSNRYLGHGEGIQLLLEPLADLVPGLRIRPTQNAALLDDPSA